jgi:hypothetical protein
MNNPRMSRTLMALFAVAGIGYAGIATANDAPISADQFSAQKSRIDMTYKSEMESCKPLSGNTKDLCEVSAKGHRDVALAENEAAYKPTVKARYDARLARADADYKLAKEKCDDFAGNTKDVCVKQAQAAEVKAKADAKVDRVAADSNQSASRQVAEAKQDAREDKLTADYKVAIEKCDVLAGDAKARCVADAKVRFGRS